MSKLYTTQLLALAAELANYPLHDGFDHIAEARSSVCGSTMTLGLDRDGEGRITSVGMQVSACAIGQSSAAVVAGGIAGRSARDLHEARKAMKRWLSGEGDLPHWPRIDALAPALAHPGRHGALILAWDAAVAALSDSAAAEPATI